MARTVDQRIVQMSFDNSKFENAAQKTLSTLQQLKGASDMKGAGKGLSSLSNAFGNFNLGPVASAIDTINSRFSTMGIVGMTVIQDLTHKAMQLGSSLVNAVSAPIMEGGFNRAMKIENAKFMLDGLLNDADKVKEVMDNVDAAVTGTAYGMDAAANVASQLVASGVQAGEGLTSTLKSVAGVAAMTNSSYEDIGAIFSTVYGQGKLMTMQLRQLEGRGMNAAAIMAEEFGTTEEAIRDMVTEGEVSAEMFTQAMLRFEESAGKANETFNGVTANIRSALARTGQAFYTPFLEQNSEFIQFLGTVRTKISDEMNKSEGMTMLVEAVVDDIYKVIRFANKVVEEFDIQGLMAGIFNLYDAAESVAQLIYNRVVRPIADAVEMAGIKFPTMDGFVEVTRRISEFFASIKDNEHRNVLMSIVRGMIASVQIAIRVFRDFWDIISPIREILVDALYLATVVLGDFGVAIALVKERIDKLDFNVFDFSFIYYPITAIAGALRTVLDAFSEWVNDDLADRMFDGFVGIADTLLSVGFSLFEFSTGLKETAKSVVDFVKNGQVFQNIINSVKGAIDKISPHLQRGREGVKTFFQSFSGETDEMDASEKFSARVGLFQGVLEKFLGVLKALGRVVKSILDPVGQAVKNFLGDITIKDLTDLGWLGLAAVIGQSIKNMLDTIATATNQMKNGSFQVLITNFNDTLVTIQRSLSGFQTTMKVYMDLQFFKTLAISLAILAGSIALLAFIPSDRLMNAAVGLSYAAAIMVGAVKLLQTNVMMLETFKVGPLVALVVGLSIAMALLAGAIAKMAKASRNGGLGAGVLAMVFSMITLVTALKVVSKLALGVDWRGLGLIVVMATAISSISKSIVRLAKVEDGMAQALGVIVMLTTMLSALMILAGIVSFNGTNGSAFAGLAVMILSVTLLVGQIRKLAKLDIKSMLGAVAAIGALLLALAGFIGLLQLIFYKSGGADTAELLGVAAALVIMSFAIRILASSIKALAAFKLENLVPSVGALVVMLIALTAACFFMSKSIVGALAIVVLTVALAALVPVITMVGAFLPAFVSGLLALAGALLFFTAASILMAPFIGSFAIMAVGMIAMGVATAVLGAGLLVLNVAFGVFVGSSAAFIAALATLIKTVADLIPYVVKKIVEGIEVFFTSISASTPRILQSVAGLILALLELLVAFIPAFCALAVEFVIAILDTIITYGPVIVQKLIDFVVTIINALADGIRENAEPILDALRNLVSSLIEFVFIAIREITEGWGPLGKAIGSLMDGAQSGTHKLITGKDLEKEVKAQNAELVAELEAGAGDAESAGEAVGTKYFDGLKKGLTGGEEGGGILDSITKQFSLDTDQFSSLGMQGGSMFSGGFMESIMGGGEEGSSLLSQFTSGLETETATFNETGMTAGDNFLSGFTGSVDEFDPSAMMGGFNAQLLQGAEEADPSLSDSGKSHANQYMDGFNEEMIAVAAPGGQAAATEINRGFEEEMIAVAAPSGSAYGTEIMSGLEEEMIAVAAPGGSAFADEIDRGFDEEMIAVAAPSGNAFGDELIKGIGEKHADANQAGKDISAEGVAGTTQTYDDWVNAGKQSASGYAAGLKHKDSLAAVRTAGAAIVTAANNATKVKAEIESPSRLWMEDGAMSAIGYALGITNNKEEAAKAGESLVDASVSRAQEAMNQFAAIGRGFGMPTVAPVIDATKVKDKLNSLSNVNLKNAKVAATSSVSAGINAQLFDKNMTAEMKKQTMMQQMQLMAQKKMAEGLAMMTQQNKNVKEVLSAVKAHRDVVLDTGKVVGALAPKMDNALGVRATRRARGS